MVDFGFSKEQDLIRKSVRQFLEKESPRDRVRLLKAENKGYDPLVWRKMTELGYPGLVIPEDCDGMGGKYLDLLIFMEEAGRSLLPSPYFATVAQCALPILAFGSEEQKKKFLPAIANGQIWTFALMEEQGQWEASGLRLSAEREAGGYVLNGTKLFVPFAAEAEKILVMARTGSAPPDEAGLTAFVVDSAAPGITASRIPTAAGDQRFEVSFSDVRAAASDIVGTQGRGWDIVEFLLVQAGVLKCAEMSGGAQAVLEMTLRYARDRIQFGRPIGSFQAIQHKLANTFIQVDGLKNLTYEAAWYIHAGQPRRDLASMAKVKANTVYEQTCINGITVHGAIGFTEEMNVGLYHLRTKAMEQELGASELHRERIAGELEKQVPLFLKR
jgi:alkylation response protein AidB-like acyl-CoA dehydrogenase